MFKVYLPTYFMCMTLHQKKSMNIFDHFYISVSLAKLSSFLKTQDQYSLSSSNFSIFLFLPYFFTFSSKRIFFSYQGHDFQSFPTCPTWTINFLPISYVAVHPDGLQINPFNPDLLHLKIFLLWLPERFSFISSVTYKTWYKYTKRRKTIF